jgi:hypothetical protein
VDTRGQTLSILFPCDLFYDSVSVSGSIVSNGRITVNNELESIWKEESEASSMYYPGIVHTGVIPGTEIFLSGFCTLIFKFRSRRI